MHPIVEGFLERPTSHKVIFWLLSVALLIGALWFVLFSGKLTERDALQIKVDSLNAEIANERRLARNLDKFRREVGELDKKLSVVLQQLPDKREIPDFLASIERKARDAGLEVTLFRPSGERFKEFYAEVPVSISVDGTYHQVATFFDEVGRLPRIVNINDISLRQPAVSEDQVRVKSDCSAVTYRYLDENERLKAAELKDTKTKKRKK